MEPVFFPEILPEFPGGNVKLIEYISNNLVYPNEAKNKGVEDIVFVRFIIEEDGLITNISTNYNKSDLGFKEEAIRIIKMMPKWTPGKIDGKFVRTEWMIPIRFPLDSTLYIETKTINKINESKNTTAKLDRFYWLKLPKYYSSKSFSEFSLLFFLDKDGNYEINLEENHYSDVQIMGYTISAGKYEIKDKIIYLTDSYTGCKMLFQLDGLGLKPLKTYPFMKKLFYNEYYVCGGIDKNNRFKETTAEKLVSDFKKKNIKTHPFTEGVYRFEYFSGNRFETTLNKDGKYEFCFKYLGKSQSSHKIYRSYFPELYLVISAGTWERKGNILVLWDTNLQHKFYGLIREDGNIEFLFFRWVDDMIYKKIN